MIGISYPNFSVFAIAEFETRRLYGAQEGLVNLDSARQSQIEALHSERGSPSPRGKGDEEDRFGEVAASPNSPNLTERRITQSRKDFIIRC